MATAPPSSICGIRFEPNKTFRISAQINAVDDEGAENSDEATVAFHPPSIKSFVYAPGYAPYNYQKTPIDSKPVVSSMSPIPLIPDTLRRPLPLVIPLAVAEVPESKLVKKSSHPPNFPSRSVQSRETELVREGFDVQRHSHKETPFTYGASRWNEIDRQFAATARYEDGTPSTTEIAEYSDDEPVITKQVHRPQLTASRKNLPLYNQNGVLPPFQPQYKSLSDMAVLYGAESPEAQDELISLLLSCRKLEQKLDEQKIQMDMLEHDLKVAQAALKGSMAFEDAVNGVELTHRWPSSDTVDLGNTEGGLHSKELLARMQREKTGSADGMKSAKESIKEPPFFGTAPSKTMTGLDDVPVNKFAAKKTFDPNKSSQVKRIIAKPKPVVFKKQ